MILAYNGSENSKNNKKNSTKNNSKKKLPTNLMLDDKFSSNESKSKNKIASIENTSYSDFADEGNNVSENAKSKKADEPAKRASSTDSEKAYSKDNMYLNPDLLNMMNFSSNKKNSVSETSESNISDHIKKLNKHVISVSGSSNAEENFNRQQELTSTTDKYEKSFEGSVASSVSGTSKNFIPKENVSSHKSHDQQSIKDFYYGKCESPQHKPSNIYAYFNDTSQRQQSSNFDIGPSMPFNLENLKLSEREGESVGSLEYNKINLANKSFKPNFVNKQESRKLISPPIENQTNNEIKLHQNANENPKTNSQKIKGDTRNVNCTIEHGLLQKEVNSLLNDPITAKYSKQFSNYQNLSDKELAKISPLLCKDQAGCRFLQKRLVENPAFGNNLLFMALYPYMIDIVIDTFGNYLIQKLIETIATEKVEKILDLLSPCFLGIGLNPHGTRVIQKLIERLNTTDLFNYFVQYLIENFLEFVSDSNACHIIIKFTSYLREPKNQIAYDILSENIVDVATNKHSCCALQKSLDVANEKQKRELMERLSENTYLLISDPFGNYVLQYIILANNYEINHKIAMIFKNNIGFLSKQKFSSNVIEKCFDHCRPDTKAIIVKELCNPKLIPELLLDMYGNYVLQKALATADEPYHSVFIGNIGPNLERLKTIGFGSKLYTKLLIMYPDLSKFIVNRGNRKDYEINRRNNINEVNNAYINKANKVARGYVNTNFRQNFNMMPYQQQGINYNKNNFNVYQNINFNPNMMYPQRMQNFNQMQNYNNFQK